MFPFEFNPETNEEKKERIKNKEEASLFKHVSLQEAMQRIADVIFKTSYYTMTKIDQIHPKFIGGIGFWVEQKEQKIELKYTIPPKKWDKDSIMIALEQEELMIINHQAGLMKR